MRRSATLRTAAVMLFAVVLMGCQRVVYSDCRTISDGWDKDSVFSFVFDIDDANVLYKTSIIVRNTDEYPNQNIWLFVDEVSPAGDVQRDTLQYFLADDLGRWRGSGIGSIYECECIYQPQQKFHKAGQYTLRITQGMRQSPLKGICEVGVKITPIDN